MAEGRAYREQGQVSYRGTSTITSHPTPKGLLSFSSVAAQLMTATPLKETIIRCTH